MGGIRTWTLLVSAAVLSVVVGETTDGAIILGIILASGLLGYWQEQRAADAVAELLALVESRTTALRGGDRVRVPLEEVVPGDVVRLIAGDTVPADARIIESRDLYVDEAALTGESFPAEKSAGTVPAETPLRERTNALFLGTHVVSGTATAVRI